MLSLEIGGIVALNILAFQTETIELLFKLVLLVVLDVSGDDGTVSGRLGTQRRKDTRLPGSGIGTLLSR